MTILSNWLLVTSDANTILSMNSSKFSEYYEHLCFIVSYLLYLFISFSLSLSLYFSKLSMCSIYMWRLDQCLCNSLSRQCFVLLHCIATFVIGLSLFLFYPFWTMFNWAKNIVCAWVVVGSITTCQFGVM